MYAVPVSRATCSLASFDVYVPLHHGTQRNRATPLDARELTDVGPWVYRRGTGRHGTGRLGADYFVSVGFFRLMGLMSLVDLYTLLNLVTQLGAEVVGSGVEWVTGERSRLFGRTYLVVREKLPRYALSRN